MSQQPPYQSPPQQNPYQSPQHPQWSPEQQAALQYRQDEEYLKVFSILYYVYAGLVALGGCFPLLYVLIGIAMMGGAAASNDADAAALAGVGGIMAAIAGLVAVVIWGLAFCLFQTGRNLAQAKGYTFCFVVACLICLNMPLGTILGVFTIVTLSRDSMKARFEANRYGGGNISPPTAWQPPPEKAPPPYQRY